MKNKKISIRSVFNQSMSLLGANWQKAFMSSLLQFGVFLIVFALTNSVLVSLVCWLIFLPTQAAYLVNMSNENAKLEHVFKPGKNWLTYILLAIVTVICYACGFALAVVPAILLFVNYAFVFDYAKDNDLFESFKKSRNLAKGYRSKILLFSLIYLFILLVLIAFGILVAMLIGLWLQTNNYMLYVWGTFAGLCLFLVFVNPVMSLTTSYLKKSIEQDREQKESQKNIQQDVETTQEKTEESKVAKIKTTEPDNQSDENHDSDDQVDDQDPTSLIV